LVLLYPQDNRSLQAAEPSKKKTPYLQHPIYLTKTASGLDGLADEDRKKLLKLFSEAGITNFDWNLDSWDEKSVQARAEFYFALLKHDLTSC
jgi:hypothetical protein